MFERSREALIQIREALGFAPDWIVALIILGLAATLALGTHSLAMRLLHRIFGQPHSSKSVLAAIGGPTRLALIVLGLSIALPTVPLPPETNALLVRLLLVTVIGLIGWTAITALNTAATLHLMRFRTDSEDDLQARKHITQIR